MIKINLLGTETVVDTSGRAWVAGYLASLVLLLGAFALLHAVTISSIDDLTEQRDTLESEIARLSKVTKEVRDLESKDKELKGKLVVIADLKKSKTGPVRVLDDLNIAIPERAWLTLIRENQKVLRLEGQALDNQTIAKFVDDLERSDFFESVEILEAKQVEKEGVKIMQFILSARVSYSGLARAASPTAAADDPKAARKS